MSSFLSEICRKTIHLSSLWISIVYFYSDKELMLAILIPFSIISIIIDLCRRYSSSLHEVINKFLGFMMRDEEKNNFAIVGATYLLSSAAITIYLFNKEVAIFSLAILSISDTFAAIIGKKFGQRKLVGNKTLEGSAAFFMASIIVYAFIKYYLNYDLDMFRSVLAITLATALELYAKKIKIDDNFIIPLAIGFCFTF